MSQLPHRSVTDIDTFVNLMHAACIDPGINATPEQLLSMPDKKQQSPVHIWVTDMMLAGAPPDFIQAVACLMDDAIVEKAYETIFNCKRGESR